MCSNTLSFKSVWSFVGFLRAKKIKKYIFWPSKLKVKMPMIYEFICIDLLTKKKIKVSNEDTQPSINFIKIHCVFPPWRGRNPNFENIKKEGPERNLGLEETGGRFSEREGETQIRKLNLVRQKRTKIGTMRDKLAQSFYRFACSSKHCCLLEHILCIPCIDDIKELSGSDICKRDQQI